MASVTPYFKVGDMVKYVSKRTIYVGRVVENDPIENMPYAGRVYKLKFQNDKYFSISEYAPGPGLQLAPDGAQMTISSLPTFIEYVQVDMDNAIMNSTPETQFLRSVIPTLPTEIASKIRGLCALPTNEIFFENFVRFLSGAGYASESSQSIQDQWSEKQAAARAVLVGLNPILADKKRTREDDAMDVTPDSQQSKRQRLSPSADGSNGIAQPGVPLFTLHATSTTSPIRKKVDLTVYQKAIVFTNPSSKAVEGTVPLAHLKRAFIVPTRGKSKPHWTIIILSSDVPDNPKIKAAPGALPSENQQVIFGLDANSAAGFATSSYSNNGDASPQTHPKNTPTLPHIQTFLSHLNIPVIQPSASTFKSSCSGVLAGSSASADGIPGVEAYRGAKSGNIWFSEEGLLWGESKPCEFWAVEDLIGKEEGVRLVGNGRTCTVVLTRRGTAAEAEGEEDLGEETEFGMIDGKERDAISTWIRNHRHLFGRRGASLSVEEKGKGKEKEVKKSKPVNMGPLTINSMPDDSDDSDEEFKDDVSDLDGSEALSGESGSEADSGSGDEDGSDEEAEGEDAGEGENAEGDEEEVQELDPAHHPLLRPGAMPRMSKAALNMAAGIVEEAFMGGGEPDEEDELEEEDELDD